MFRVAAVYLVVGFVIIQVAEITYPALQLPDWALTLTVVLTGLGFPIAIVLAWAFELTPEGMKREAPPPDSVGAASGPGAAAATASPAAPGSPSIHVPSPSAASAVLPPPVIPDGEPPEKIESIAVLPFADLSPDQDQEYFVDGMTEAITSKLARVPGLRVISRTSAMRYRRSDAPLPQIARELNVQAIVEGSVLRAGNRVRIVAQLIGAATDEHLWAESYEGELDDVLKLQSEVAVAAAREIKSTLSADEEKTLTGGRKVEVESYKFYLKGRHAWSRRTREGFEKALEAFGKAIERDPSNALAYSGLADTYVVMMFYQYLTGREALPPAKMAAQRAIELDANLPEAHASLAWAKLWERDFAGSEASFLRAIEINPNHANTRHWYANLLVFTGRKDEAIAEMRKAAELDPLSAPISNSMGWVLYVVGETDAAIRQLEETLELEPTFSNSHLLLSLCWLEKGDTKRALRHMRRAGELDPENHEIPTFLAYVLARAGRQEEAREALAEGKERKIMPARIAIVHGALGEIDKAIGWLERAYVEHPESLLNLKLYPWYDPLRDDPRFQDLLERVGLG